jgi:hypothetical protein
MSDFGESEGSVVEVHTPPTALPPTARPFRFTWDAVSKRAGPESVSGTTHADYFAAKAPHLALSTSSALPLGALPQDWSSARHGFNGMPTHSISRSHDFSAALSYLDRAQ